MLEIRDSSFGPAPLFLPEGVNILTARVIVGSKLHHRYSLGHQIRQLQQLQLEALGKAAVEVLQALDSHPLGGVVSEGAVGGRERAACKHHSKVLSLREVRIAEETFAMAWQGVAGQPQPSKRLNKQ